MDLPRKNRDGKSILSYSQIKTFRYDKNEYYKTYILNKPFITNPYIEFGNKVGTALENNDFDNFNDSEIQTLKKVTRLDLFERFTKLEYVDFDVVGYIDTINNSLDNIIDYKTGGINKEFQYENGYDQLHIYALSIRQETGITPKKASVEFLRRKGNLRMGQELYISDENPIKIEIDINLNQLKRVYWDTLKTAKEIELFYKEYK